VKEELSIPLGELLRLLRERGYPAPKDVHDLEVTFTTAGGESLTAKPVTRTSGVGRLTLCWDKSDEGLPIVEHPPPSSSLPKSA
jgi:hypothetical protein